MYFSLKEMLEGERKIPSTIIVCVTSSCVDILSIFYPVFPSLSQSLFIVFNTFLNRHSLPLCKGMKCVNTQWIRIDDHTTATATLMSVSPTRWHPLPHSLPCSILEWLTHTSTVTVIKVMMMIPGHCDHYLQVTEYSSLSILSFILWVVTKGGNELPTWS